MFYSVQKYLKTDKFIVGVSWSGSDGFKTRKLAPVAAFKDDFSQKKLTSFDKLLPKTCSIIKNVRVHPNSSAASSGVAPDAAYTFLSFCFFYSFRFCSKLFCTKKCVAISV